MKKYSILSYKFYHRIGVKRWSQIEFDCDLLNPCFQFQTGTVIFL